MVDSSGLPGPLAALQPLLDHYGYAALALLVALDNMLVPVPGQTLLIVAAVYAGTGRMNVLAVAVVAWIAAAAGAEIAYLLGRREGTRLITRFGRYVRLTPERYAKAEDFYRRRGSKVVVVARFVDVLRQTNGLLAGSNEMPHRRFTLWNAVGAAAWVAAWTALGYTAGTDIGPLYRQALRYQFVLLVAVALAIVCAVLRAWWRARKRQREES
ncbi:DedA family protein [Streptacidiphilus jiangxiensis]|uniref:Membrane protein DedA, SNARE-associated domain n=1 Tax=Streptacidiphilus jiangxiensis TaxID=235985 RepID=A0A1H7VVS2_STRJI|nr:DedA family protein [Streptacidiphilus jiangxiensis]SEM13280.1 membrane protein DedA, SNARE-associated domain [Streptacidiphilus jiangxiensis]